MRKFVVIAIVVAVVGGAAAYFGVFSRGGEAASGPQAGGPGGGQRPQGGGGGGFGGGGFGGPGGGGGFPRVPMTVELGTATRGDVAAHLTVVGNLIGLQTVDIAPRTGGRLLSVNVQLGDRVRRGQVLAKVEDREIVEQVRAAEASQEVAKATIRQREADLKVAELNFERSKNLFARQLLAKQALDDAESRYMAAVAQTDLSKAQLSQNDARLQELRINLQHTSVTSPVDGYRRQAQRRSGRDGEHQHRHCLGRRHLAAAPGGQRRREGSPHRQRRRRRRRRSRCLSRAKSSPARLRASPRCSTRPRARPPWKSRSRTTITS